MIRKSLITLITLYKRLLSPLLPSRCRFYPSCADYAKEAIEMHGSARGSLLALKRLAKCHPLHKGGVDPVPDPDKRIVTSKGVE